MDSEALNQSRHVSVAQIGGFRPPDNPLASWFGGNGVGLPDETLPTYQGKAMFPLLQVNVTELPYVPIQFEQTKFFILFLNRDEIPFDKPHGEGWLIREYETLEGLQPFPSPTEPKRIKPFPIKWNLQQEDDPDELVYGTKIGGFPFEVQHDDFGEGDFVFQVGSEEKPQWMWADNGIGYFLKDEDNNWRFECQFY